MAREERLSRLGLHFAAIGCCAAGIWTYPSDYVVQLIPSTADIIMAGKLIAPELPREVLQAFLSSGLDIVPCHNDAMRGNFLVHLEGDRILDMKIVDFKFASNNERAYEIGAFLRLVKCSSIRRRRKSWSNATTGKCGAIWEQDLHWPGTA